jgi:uncharacterized surface protein with fasciclin (FAS1) repeats
MLLKNKYLILALLLTACFTSCKKWDDHTEVTNPNLNMDLGQAIAANADLSKFREYLVKTGLDDMLASSRTYTVWAPTNAALATLDQAIVNDTAKLRNFLMNHISVQSYFTRDAQPGTRVGMMNGKYNTFSATKFDEANITSADNFYRNGVLHVIDKSVLVLPNLWDYIRTNTSQYSQNAYIAGLNFESFDPSLAIVDSISALTGQPVYKPGSGIDIRNRFNDRVYDFQREDKQFTYFVMADAGFTLESDSLKNYFKAATPAANDSLARYQMVKDLAVEGLYLPGALPATLTSKFGVTIPINQANIIETRRVSNGIVYVMSNIDVLTASKFKEIRIEGENPSGFERDRTSNTNYRVRLHPVTGQVFRDIMISGHGVTAYYAYYRLTEMPSIKYRVYGFGVNDFQTGAFTQNIVVKSLNLPATYTTLATLAHPVPLNTAVGAYDEKLLGEFTVNNFGILEIQLTSTATNPLVLDYLRLVPVLN